MAVVEHIIERGPAREVAAALLNSAALPSADLTGAHMEHFFYCGNASSPRGLVGLEFCGSVALLRSLVVAVGHRSAGIGAQLLMHAEQYARATDARSIYLLTTAAEAFFAHRGYVAAARESAPAEIRNTREFADICPASATLMVKHL